MISIIQAVQNKHIIESLPGPSPSSRSATAKSSTLDFKKLKNDALTDLAATSGTQAKDEEDQTSDKAAENGLGLVLPDTRLLQVQTTEEATTVEGTSTVSTAVVMDLITGLTQNPDAEIPELMDLINQISAGKQETLPQSVQDLLKNIADILEGSGMLKNGTTAEEAVQAAAQLLTGTNMQVQVSGSAVDKPGVDTQNSTDAVGNLAGMLEDTTNIAVRTQVKELISKYLCSLENTGKLQEQPDAAMQQGTDTTMEQGADAATFTIIQHEKDAHTGVHAQTETTEIGTEPKKTQTTQPTFVVATPKTIDVQSPAAEQVSPAPSPAGQVDMSDNIARIVESITTLSAENTQEFTIALKPEHLGRLSIKLVMDSEGLRAHIKAADASVSSLIRGELNSLTEILRDKGIQLNHIDVTYDTAALLSDPRQGNQGQYQGSFTKGRRGYALNTAEPYSVAAATADVQQMLAQGSSMEFQA